MQAPSLPHRPPPITPGLLALHGNCAETLAQTLMQWSHNHPLAPLEEEIVLVQSIGTAEWFKMLQAQQHGLCAATRVELPARFLWRSWRQILGKVRVPSVSPLDELPMTWRLMRLLPQLAQEHPQPFAAIARFLRHEQPQRLLQLSSRLADLFDQYQVYRGDWLQAWEAGQDVLPGLPGQTAKALPPGQEWQPLLWRAVLADLTPQERAVTRPALWAEILATLQQAPIGSLPVARRVLLLGLTHVPLSMLEFLAALSRHSQVVLAVPNPCRYHWADAIDGRELLRQQRRRQSLRQGVDLAQLPLEAMHAHAHPLLMAWGRQSRDYVRLLDDFENSPQLEQSLMPLTRVDLFDDAPADTGSLLQQVQRSIRDLLPLAEHPRPTQPTHYIPASDQSIVLHSAHSLLRELEVLHDHLLTLFASGQAQPPVQPRDVIVMLPDIGAAAPAIRAVFGQHSQHDARRIPFAIADLSVQAASPLVVALEWLLRLPQQRCRLSELSDLLDVPALAARLGLAAEDAPQLRHWMAQAGIRWGLSAQQRASLDLQACGDTNSAWFGLQRMLLGYASGSHPVQQAGLPASPAWAQIEPFAEVGGLDAELAGVLAALLTRLLAWWEQALQPTTPEDWAQRLRSLLDDLFTPQDVVETAVLQGLEQSLQDWLRACDHARFSQLLPLEVVQAAWLQALQAPALEQRFQAGGVTFCTLMPMRAIPFKVVCLLGMNEGDYPRRSQHNSFDLMQQPGSYRPGDRARRDHDRQLMLDALLSARQQLYLSWTGQHVRDNSALPPSVLVAQLRDYLQAGWRGADGQDVLAQRSYQHPLQPFSRRYFEAGSPLSTFAKEWLAAHQVPATPAAPALPVSAQAAAQTTAQTTALSLQQLASFMRHPARHYLRQQLQVVFATSEEVLQDEELFTLAGLDAYQLVEQLQNHINYLAPRSADLEVLVSRQLDSLERSGHLPLAGLGAQEKQALLGSNLSSLQAWAQLQAHFSAPAPHQALLFSQAELELQDWLDGLRHPPSNPQAPAWLALQARALCNAQGQPRLDKLMPAYVRSLVASACGLSVPLWLVGRDCALHILPLPQDAAQQNLSAWLAAWQQGRQTPLPLPVKTALAWAEQVEQSPETAQEKARSAYEGGYQHQGEGQELEWARFFPDFEALTADGQFAPLAQQLYAPVLAWGKEQVRVVVWEELEGAVYSAHQRAPAQHE